MTTVTVSASKKYDVIIGSGILENTGEYAKNTIGICSAAIITDDIVDSFYGSRLSDSLAQKGFKVYKYVIKNGEKSKNTDNYIKILNFLAANHLTRTDAVFALGGGVVGDLAGFAAATYLRGIHFVQIPTTLLAAVDSSVGGKTAVNLENGKNLAGAFYQPDLVLCDISTLGTLPENIFKDGCAEVIKYGCIADRELFNLLKNDIKPDLENIISRCVKIKAEVVCSDEFDTGRRQLLNFGHTVGHAIEACSDYNISHGSAVAAGMCIIAKAAANNGFCNSACADEITELVEKYGLPSSCSFDCNRLYDIILNDKKRADDYITLVIPKETGKCILQKVPVTELKSFIKVGF